MELRRPDQALAQVGRPRGQRLHDEQRFEQSKVTTQGGVRDARRARHFGHVQQRTGPRRQKRQQARHVVQAFDIGVVAHVALQQAGEVGTEPRVAPLRIGTAQRLREPARQQPTHQIGAVGWHGAPRPGRAAEQGVDEVVRRAFKLALRQGLQRQHLHAPRQRLSRIGQHEHVGRAREQETARYRMAVDFALDGGQQRGRELHLVDDRERCPASDES